MLVLQIFGCHGLRPGPRQTRIRDVFCPFCYRSRWGRGWHCEQSCLVACKMSVASLGLSSKESTCNAGAAGDAGSISGSGRSPGGGHGNPLQYSCLEKPLDRGAWWATVHDVVKSWTGVKREHTRTHTHTHTHKMLVDSSWSDLG